ncbi:S-layer homology domain-containing protein [Fictibacillus sp. NPDC058756]|uniref:S-layer homology domain-containing protein n=1 Tax=Fictibacillus sp. NPDC058756 TaxID=3346625 RepID=UPI0036C2F115
MKKFVGGLLSAAIIAGTLASPVKADFKNPMDDYFPDDTWEHWAEGDMLDMLQSDILRGQKVTDRKWGITYLYLNPDKTITRAEFVAMIVRALELETTKQGIKFTDTTGHWAQNDINTASALGVVSGKTSTTFDPNGKITRAEIASILYRAYDPTVYFEKGTPKNFTDLPSTQWAYNHIRQVNGVKIINGTTGTTVSPGKNATRAEAAAMIRRALSKEEVSLPNAADLTALILEDEHGWFEGYNNRDADTLDLLNDENHFGFAHSYIGMDNEMYRWMFEDEEMQEFEDVYTIKGDPSLTVLSKSTRFATVKVENFIVENTYEYPEYDENDEPTGKIITETDVQDRSGVYNLVRRDGSWKVYTNDFIENIFYYFDEEEEEL